MLKEEYLVLQKSSMASLKKCIAKIYPVEDKSLVEMSSDPQDKCSKFCFHQYQHLKLNEKNEMKPRGDSHFFKFFFVQSL